MSPSNRRSIESRFTQMTDSQGSTIALRAAMRTIPLLSDASIGGRSTGSYWVTKDHTREILEILLTLQAGWYLNNMFVRDLSERELLVLAYRRAVGLKDSISELRAPFTQV